MGQFSWLDCLDQTQVVDNAIADVYVLIPKEFGGGRIYESCYDGYGHFGSYDIYDLVASWNRKAIDLDTYTSRCLVKPERENYGGLWSFQIDELRKAGLSEEEISVKNNEIITNNYNAALRHYEQDKELLKRYCTCDKPEEEFDLEVRRHIGIIMACYDEDNSSLPYPIKITHSSSATYEDCRPSLSDPNQGWVQDEEDDEDYY